MRYPVAIHHDNNSAYGVSVPDIPGCFSAGDTFDEALDNAAEAIKGHLTLLAEDRQSAPIASHVDDHIRKKVYKGAVWGFVDIDVSAFSGRTEKINVTLPQITSTLIDELVKQGKAKNRSAFLAEAALEKIAALKLPKRKTA